MECSIDSTVTGSIMRCQQLFYSLSATEWCNSVDMFRHLRTKKSLGSLLIVIKRKIVGKS